MARGVSVTLDEYGPMALPVPDGFRYVAKMDWMRPGELRVIDGKGEMYAATTEGSVELEHESIHLEIRVVRQFRYQRLPSFAAAMSSLAGLFIIGQLILSLGLVSGQGVQSCEVYCSTWLGHYTQVPAREWSRIPLSFTDRLCQCPVPPDQVALLRVPIKP